LPEYHYLNVKETPTIVDGKERDIDDMQPRVQLKKMHGTLSQDNAQCITDFCNKFIVKEQHVRKYLEHLDILSLNKEKRKSKTKGEKTLREGRQYQAYDWSDLYQSDKLKKLLNSELDKYLIHHKMTDKMPLSKVKKLQWIGAHIGKKRFWDLENEERNESEAQDSGDEDESDLEQEVVQAVVPSASDKHHSEPSSSDEQLEKVQRTTRSGRTVKNSHINKDMMWY
jgi:hypothetical protein